MFEPLTCRYLNIRLCCRYGLETVIGPIEIKHTWSPETKKDIRFTIGFILNLIYINKNSDICYNENKMARFIDYLHPHQEKPE
jgi:hypothetical protein